MIKLNTIAIIPARYKSTRLPGKMLLDLAGKTLIQRTYLQVKKAKKIDEIYIATDDERIFKHAQSFGAKVILTAEHHISGTDRCYEALQKIQKKPDFIINVQGDEPFIQPEKIDFLVELLKENNQITTLCYPLEKQDAIKENIVKVVKTITNRALYFSRSPIPFDRDNQLDHTYFAHVGIYGFPVAIFEKIQELSLSSLEKMEFLEQLRWLENNFSIYVGQINEATIGIDTIEDVQNVIKNILLNK